MGWEDRGREQGQGRQVDREGTTEKFLSKKMGRNLDIRRIRPGDIS